VHTYLVSRQRWVLRIRWMNVVAGIYRVRRNTVPGTDSLHSHGNATAGPL